MFDSNRRRGVIPAIHYRFNLKEKNISESVNFLLTKTDLESQHLLLHICCKYIYIIIMIFPEFYCSDTCMHKPCNLVSSVPHTLGNSDSATQRGQFVCIIIVDDCQ